MAKWLVTAVVTPLINELNTMVKLEAIKLIKVQKDLLQLQHEMVEVRDTLMDNEGRNNQRRCNLHQLRRLNEAMYNAEDIIDDIRRRFQLKGGPGSDSDEQVSLPSCSCPRFFPDLAFRYRIGSRIRAISEEIQETLSVISSKDVETKSKEDIELVQPTDCYHGIVYDDIVGLESQTAGLLDVLTKGTDSNIQNTIYAIVGMPGIGKTTLAKKVFEKLEKTKNHFDKNIWLHIGNNDGISILKSLISKFDVEWDENNQDPGVIMTKIEEIVTNKRILVVLDDCWSSDVWERFLRTPVSKAAKGSAVLMTTRNEEVARRMRAIHPFLTPSLSAANALLLLCNAVFGKYTEVTGELKRIGENIVKQSEGNPLVIKAIAGLIAQNVKKDTASVWTKVLESRKGWIEGDLRSALRTSYDDLAYHLKLCFCHCSLFSKGFTFHYHQLVQHWAAEGFLSLTDSESMDTEGSKCYQALLSRNLLQPEPSHVEGKASTMHDVMHEFGNCVSTTHFVKISNRKRHVYKVNENLSEVPEISREKSGYLRTLVLSMNHIKCIPEGYMEKLQRLRVLDLSYTFISELPDSIGDLTYLRLLHLSYTRLETLPKSIRNLQRLQSLQLKGSKLLKELPNELVELSSLACLLLETASINSLPLGLKRLQNLITLHGFLLNTDASNMTDLYNLSGLTELTLYRLERLPSLQELPADVLRNKKLTYIRLSCNHECVEDVPSANAIEQAFEKVLQPSSMCINFHIDGYMGKAFPSWMKTSQFDDLQWLRLDNCKLVKQLPPLGDFPKLKSLDIRSHLAVTTIGPEFFGNLKFPQLEELHFIDLAELCKWDGLEEGSFPCLKKMEIMRCHKLEHLPRGMNLVTSLTELLIDEADELTEIKDHLSISKIRIRRIPKLKEVSNLPKLELLRVRICRSLEKLTGLPSLRHLILSDYRMSSLPEWLPNMITLERLDLEVSRNLLIRLGESLYKAGTIFDKFQHIERVEVRVSIKNKNKTQNEQGEHAENGQSVTNDSDLFISYIKSQNNCFCDLGKGSSIISGPSSSNANNFG